MKKRIPIIVISVWLLISIGFFLYGICNIHRTLETLASDPGTSGIDYLGIGWSCGLVLFCLAAIGLLFTALSTKALRTQGRKHFHRITVFLFLLLIVAAVWIFYL